MKTKTHQFIEYLDSVAACASGYAAALGHYWLAIALIVLGYAITKLRQRYDKAFYQGELLRYLRVVIGLNLKKTQTEIIDAEIISETNTLLVKNES